MPDNPVTSGCLYCDPQAILTPKEIAAILKMHQSTVDSMLKRGDIRSAMHGNRGGRGERRVLRVDFEAYLVTKYGLDLPSEVPL